MTRVTRLNPRSTNADAQPSGVGRKIIVKPTGGDYASPKLATDWISTQNPGPNNQFDVWVYPGVYTEIQWETAAYTTYRGIGRRDLIWLQGAQPDSATDAQTTNNSTIVFKQTASLVNLKITAKNMRYPVHADGLGLNKDAVHLVDGCHIEHYGNQGVVNYRVANSIAAGTPWLNCLPWGSGTASGLTDTLVNTTLIGPTYGSFYVHTNANFDKPNINTLDKCRVVSTDPTQPVILVQPLGSGQIDRLNVTNTEVSGGNFARESDNPWIPTDLPSQFANHSEIRFTYSGTPIGWDTLNRGKALKITSAKTGTTTYGPLLLAGSSDAPSATTAKFTVPDATFTAAGVITQVSVGLATTGYLGLSIGTISGATFTERVRTGTFTATATGRFDFSPNVAVLAGETVALYGTAAMYFGANAGSTLQSYNMASGAISTVAASFQYGARFTLQSAVTSTVSVSGTAADAVFGTSPNYRDGGGGLQGYAYGDLDISGILVDINSSTTVNNTIGKRLGNCSTVNKTLTVTVDGGSPVNVVFNTDLTAVSNATIIATINTALGSGAVAAEYLVSQGETYPNFVDRQTTMVNGSTVLGIPRWSAVKKISGQAQLMQPGDAVSLFYGVSVEPIAPGQYGRILTAGLLQASQLAGTPTITNGSPIYHSDTAPGGFATNGTRQFGIGSINGYCSFNGSPVATTDPAAAPLTSAGTIGSAANTRYVYLVGAGGAPAMPTAVGNTARYVFKNTSNGNVSLPSSSGQAFDGGASPLVIGPLASVSLISDNANWWVI